MGHIVWRERMSVGIARIDEDHKAMVGYLNQLEMALSDPDYDERRVARILLYLVEYTKAHFDREEKLMLAIDFPDFDEHKKQHDKARRNLRDIGIRFMKTPTMEEGCRIQEFVADWLIRHIIMEDTRIAAFVN